MCVPLFPVLTVTMLSVVSLNRLMDPKFPEVQYEVVAYNRPVYPSDTLVMHYGRLIIKIIKKYDFSRPRFNKHKHIKTDISNGLLFFFSVRVRLININVRRLCARPYTSII